MSSTSPLGQRSSAPEATSFLVFALASALLVYALKTRSSEVRAEEPEGSPRTESLDAGLEFDAANSPKSEVMTREARVAPVERRRD